MLNRFSVNIIEKHRMICRLFTLVGLFFLFLVNTVFACVCSEENVPVCKTFAEAEIIFIGRLASLSGKSAGIQSPKLVQIARFEIVRLYKGKIDNKSSVEIPTGDCGYEMIVGKEYFVYSYKTILNNVYEVKTCGRTRLTAFAKEDINFANDFVNGKFHQSIVGKITGLLREETSKIKIIIRKNNKKEKVNINQDGEFNINQNLTGKFTVTVTFPLILDLYVLGNPRGNLKNVNGKTIFTYDVHLKKGECDFREIVVSKL